MNGHQGAPAARPSGSTLAAAVRLLSGRRMTRAQLAQKLRDRGHASEAIDAALVECERRKYLDDRTYAQLHLKSVLDRKAIGRLRLFQELVRNGVDGDLAREVLDELEDDEDARLERALSKLEAMRPGDGYAQLGRRLERLGFGAPNIARALRRSAERRGAMADHMEALD